MKNIGQIHFTLLNDSFANSGRSLYIQNSMETVCPWNKDLFKQ